MPKCKEIANEVLHAQIYDVMEKYHPELHEAEVKVTAFLVSEVTKTGEKIRDHALKLHGQPCVATIRKANQREMKLGSGDLIMEIDEHSWYSDDEDLDTATKISVLDHELEHVKLKKDKEGAIVLTPDNRPALRLRYHDAEIGIFFDIIKRHGKASMDFQTSNRLLLDIREVLDDRRREADKAEENEE